MGMIVEEDEGGRLGVRLMQLGRGDLGSIGWLGSASVLLRWLPGRLALPARIKSTQGYPSRVRSAPGIDGGCMHSLPREYSDLKTLWRQN